MSRRIGILMGIALLACACARGGDSSGKSRGPREAVNLPPAPNLDTRPAAEKYQDGTLSVEGFAKHAREMLGKPATVRGQVVAVNTCPKDRELCEVVPHAVVVDDPANARRKMFVVTDPPGWLAEAFTEKGPRTLEGTVSLWSPDGRMVNLDGLLVVAKPAPKPEEKPAGKTPVAKKK